MKIIPQSSHIENEQRPKHIQTQLFYLHAPSSPFPILPSLVEHICMPALPSPHNTDTQLCSGGEAGDAGNK